jgi:hypothetical protein
MTDTSPTPLNVKRLTRWAADCSIIAASVLRSNSSRSWAISNLQLGCSPGSPACTLASGRGGHSAEMNSAPNPNRCERAELACAYRLQALPRSEVPAMQAHIASCPDCQRELESLRPVVNRFISWPADPLRPTTSLQERLALRISEGTGKQPALPPVRRWSEPEWERVAPGIECKLLATDTKRGTPHAWR